MSPHVFWPVGTHTHTAKGLVKLRSSSQFQKCTVGHGWWYLLRKRLFFQIPDWPEVSAESKPWGGRDDCKVWSPQDELAEACPKPLLELLVPDIPEVNLSTTPIPLGIPETKALRIVIGIMQVPTSIINSIHSRLFAKVAPTCPVLVSPRLLKFDPLLRLLYQCTISFKVSYSTTFVTLLSLRAWKSFAFSFLASLLSFCKVPAVARKFLSFVFFVPTSMGVRSLLLEVPRKINLDLKYSTMVSQSARIQPELLLKCSSGLVQQISAAAKTSSGKWGSDLSFTL